ncbi:hypothetical protein AFC81_17095 [Mycobacterium avium subsp. paratuberculosis]|nr:hypothetical protein A0V42_09825 [Mycobacterium avium subsp. paratuberculosis]OHW66224.1 hypothetical protein AFC81_17095 [Mycobacterium avium subsp. paratuberculosis]OHW67394.1 hypothetical protein AFC79_16235 [Mycobacterium avium subsp. paratuberculosis]OHW67521.1 hypothetical protein AFC82_16220 [Mycobacterium avium subsp. paratuberculosis]OHW78163.1 hypothetical protein AFC83_17140 [Mycobacterium avium subsp. paratuberculosis]
MSAPPESDDAARLPCLTTGTPAAAATIAAIVDRLRVLTPSPPVPTMSTVSSRIAPAGNGSAWFSITSASSMTSAEVGTFTCIATAKAAIWAGLASPVMIWSMAQAACPRARSSPPVSRASTWRHDVAGPPEGRRAAEAADDSDDNATRRWSHAGHSGPNLAAKGPVGAGA